MALAAITGLWAVWSFLGPGPSRPGGVPTDVVLAPGRGLLGVAHDLQAAHVVGSSGAFVAAAFLTGAAHELKAGEYEFASGASMARVISIIRQGRVVRRLITIPEGLTSREAVRILRAADYLQGQVDTPVEGVLLPETYQARRGEARSKVLGEMMAARDSLLDRLWRDRDPGLPYGSPREAVILASVVEKETAKADERPRVAAVFLNRLKKGMRLQSDPTVIYGVSGGRPLGHGLRASELAAATPFNTYRVSGLPPSPIDNPGRASLEAAFHPSRTDDLYFVADGSGGHVFADTYEAHARNVARWRQLEASHSAGGSQ